jgi:hypothetical protein
VRVPSFSFIRRIKQFLSGSIGSEHFDSDYNATVITHCVPIAAFQYLMPRQSGIRAHEDARVSFLKKYYLINEHTFFVRNWKGKEYKKQ